MTAFSLAFGQAGYLALFFPRLSRDQGEIVTMRRLSTNIHRSRGTDLVHQPQTSDVDLSLTSFRSHIRVIFTLRGARNKYGKEKTGCICHAVDN